MKIQRSFNPSMILGLLSFFVFFLLSFHPAFAGSGPPPPGQVTGGACNASSIGWVNSFSRPFNYFMGGAFSNIMNATGPIAWSIFSGLATLEIGWFVASTLWKGESFEGLLSNLGFKLVGIMCIGAAIMGFGLHGGNAIGGFIQDFASAGYNIASHAGVATGNSTPPEITVSTGKSSSSNGGTILSNILGVGICTANTVFMAPFRSDLNKDANASGNFVSAIQGMVKFMASLPFVIIYIILWLGIIILFTMLAAEMFVALFEAFIMLSVGFFMLGFLGSTWTRSVGQTYISYFTSVMMRLFVIDVVVGFSAGMLTSIASTIESYNWDGSTLSLVQYWGSLMETAAELGIALIFCFMMLKKLPALVGALGGSAGAFAGTGIGMAEKAAGLAVTAGVVAATAGAGLAAGAASGAGGGIAEAGVGGAGSGAGVEGVAGSVEPPVPSTPGGGGGGATADSGSQSSPPSNMEQSMPSQRQPATAGSKGDSQGKSSNDGSKGKPIEVAGVGSGQSSGSGSNSGDGGAERTSSVTGGSGKPSNPSTKSEHSMAQFPRASGQKSSEEQGSNTGNDAMLIAASNVNPSGGGEGASDGSTPESVESGNEEESNVPVTAGASSEAGATNTETSSPPGDADSSSSGKQNVGEVIGGISQAVDAKHEAMRNAPGAVASSLASRFHASKAGQVAAKIAGSTPGRAVIGGVLGGVKGGMAGQRAAQSGLQKVKDTIAPTGFGQGLTSKDSQGSQEGPSGGGSEHGGSTSAYSGSSGNAPSAEAPMESGLAKPLESSHASQSDTTAQSPSDATPGPSAPINTSQPEPESPPIAQSKPASMQEAVIETLAKATPQTQIAPSVSESHGTNVPDMPKPQVPDKVPDNF